MSFAASTAVRSQTDVNGVQNHIILQIFFPADCLVCEAQNLVQLSYEFNNNKNKNMTMTHLQLHKQTGIPIFQLSDNAKQIKIKPK